MRGPQPGNRRLGLKIQELLPFANAEELVISDVKDRLFSVQALFCEALKDFLRAFDA